MIKYKAIYGREDRNEISLDKVVFRVPFLISFINQPEGWWWEKHKHMMPGAIFIHNQNPTLQVLTLQTYSFVPLNKMVSWSPKKHIAIVVLLESFFCFLFSVRVKQFVVNTIFKSLLILYHILGPKNIFFVLKQFFKEVYPMPSVA